MLITRTSTFSGVTRTIDMPVTDEQMQLWASGVLIQDAMPNLSDSQREFILSGMVDEEWDQMNEWMDEAIDADIERMRLDVISAVDADDLCESYYDEMNDEEM